MLKQRLRQDLNQALKNKQTVSLATLRMLLAAIHNQEIEKRAELNDEEILKVLRAVQKKYQDSISQFEAGNRQDLVSKEQAELAVLNSYLPPSLSEEQLRSLVRKTIKELRPEGQQDFGRVMKEVMSGAQDRAEGARVSQMVKEELNPVRNPKADSIAGN